MSASNRIFYLDDIPTPYRLGVQREIAKSWTGDFHIAFCAAEEPGRSWELDFSGLSYSVLPGRLWRPIGQLNPFSFKWNPTVIEALEEYAPSVVVLAGYAHPTMVRAALWCRKNKIPYAIACETSAHSTAISGFRWRMRKLAIGWMVRGMAFGLPVGDHAADYLRRFGGSETPMHYFPNTPNTEPFEQASAELSDEQDALLAREDLDLPTHGAVFTFVGRLIGAKRPQDAIDAFDRLPSDISASLLIVGDGDLADRLKAHATHNNRIRFAGWVTDQQELARILSVSDALVLPSEHEPWGAVVNESMASGTLAIASNKVGAALEIIEDGVDGFIYPVRDIHRLAEIMSRVASEEGLAKKIGDAAQRKATEFGAQFAAHNLIQGASQVLSVPKGF